MTRVRFPRDLARRNKRSTSIIATCYKRIKNPTRNYPRTASTRGVRKNKQPGTLFLRSSLGLSPMEVAAEQLGEPRHSARNREVRNSGRETTASEQREKSFRRRRALPKKPCLRCFPTPLVADGTRAISCSRHRKKTHSTTRPPLRPERAHLK